MVRREGDKQRSSTNLIAARTGRTGRLCIASAAVRGRVKRDPAAVEPRTAVRPEIGWLHVSVGKQT